MATITDTNILQFSNDTIRGNSDVILGCYHNCTDLITRRNAHGTIELTIQFEEAWIRDTASQVMEVFGFCLNIDNEWTQRVDDGGSTTLVNSIPNTTNDEIGGSATVESINGQDVHRIVDHEKDIVKWFGDAVFGGDGTGGQTDAVKNSIILCEKLSGNVPLIVAQVTTFIDTRCVQFRDEYDATAGLKLSHVTRTSSNPIILF